MNLERRILGLLGFAATLAMTGACGDGNTIEGPNKAIFTPTQYWSGYQLSGEFSNPLYPVSVPASNTLKNYTAEVVGWRQFYGPPNIPEPWQLTLNFYSPPNNSDYAWTSQVWMNFEIHPTLPGKVRARPVAQYRVGRYGDSRPDTARAEITNYGSSTISKGKAILPWKFDNVSSTVNGTPLAAINTEVWVQAVSTSLPTPHTYLWKINTITLNGVNRSYHDTVYTTVGPRIYEIKITGSNGQFVVKNWTVGVQCPGGGIFC